ncbi:MAG: PilZ domain-containing protein [Desulfuromonadales bacterium]|nr:PilZ domain-containing protein [Desulfuromonadales bacterium]
MKWRFLFDFLGVASTPLRKEKELVQSLLCDEPGLVVIDRNLLGEAFATIEASCTTWLARGGGMALTGHAGLWPLPAAFLAQVPDISERDPFMINALLHRFVPTYSRLHPRLGTRLPGLYTRSSGHCQICEIMNLSPGGAFIRTTETLPVFGEELQLNVPLIGMNKEIELSSRVVSQFFPNEENNYAQGVGVKFVTEESSPLIVELNNYVRYVLANDEMLVPRISPFVDEGSKKIGHDVKALPSRIEVGKERRLVANFR